MTSLSTLATSVSAHGGAGVAAVTDATIVGATTSEETLDGAADCEVPAGFPLRDTEDGNRESEPFLSGRFAAVTFLVLLVLSASIFASTLLATNAHHLLLPVASVIPHMSVSLLFAWVSRISVPRNTEERS